MGQEKIVFFSFRLLIGSPVAGQTMGNGMHSSFIIFVVDNIGCKCARLLSKDYYVFEYRMVFIIFA